MFFKYALVYTVRFFVVVLLLCTVRGYPLHADDEVAKPIADSLAEPSRLYDSLAVPSRLDDSIAVPTRFDDSVAEHTHVQGSELFLSPLNEGYYTGEGVLTNQPDQQREIVDAEGGSQNFYPSFFDYDTPLGHSRPYTFHQETAYSQRPYTPRQQQLQQYERAILGRFKDTRVKAASTRSEDLLGSGNFGVIRGGTFYNENDDISLFGAGNNHQIFSPYYQNGHGRPSFYYTPKQNQQEQFANFRDFADINAPSNPAYSQYVIVYANKNSTNEKRHEEENNKNVEKFAPKNIIERLKMLDKEINNPSENEPLKKKKQLSDTKKKLSLVPPEKKPWNAKNKKKLNTKDTDSTQNSNDLYEPLLALS